jgi:IS66 C-terminal element
MFYGSDTHDEAAAAIFSIIASCRLHSLDPYQYLEEILRVLPYWPSDRYLKLAPKYWRATRGRLRTEELAAPLSAFEIPPVDGGRCRGARRARSVTALALPRHECADLATWVWRSAYDLTRQPTRSNCAGQPSA